MTDIKELPTIPSEFIEPYLAAFLSQMTSFVLSAKTSEQKEKDGLGWTITDIRQWIKGVEVFTNMYCGLHAQLVMGNQHYNIWNRMTDEQLLDICKKIHNEKDLV